jgi:hypothetical protein
MKNDKPACLNYDKPMRQVAYIHMYCINTVKLCSQNFENSKKILVLKWEVS